MGKDQESEKVTKHNKTSHTREPRGQFFPRIVKVCRGCTGTIYAGITKDDWGNTKQYIWVQPQQILTQYLNAIIIGTQYRCSLCNVGFLVTSLERESNGEYKYVPHVEL